MDRKSQIAPIPMTTPIGRVRGDGYQQTIAETRAGRLLARYLDVKNRLLGHGVDGDTRLMWIADMAQPLRPQLANAARRLRRYARGHEGM